MLSSKKIDLYCNGTSQQVFICPRAPYLPLPYLTHSIQKRQIGKGGRRSEREREGERGKRGEKRSQSWVDNTNMT
jgi:hypothetical protein